MADLAGLTKRQLLLEIISITERLETRMATVEEDLAAATAALEALKVDIAAEIQQVLDGLAATADVEAAKAGLEALTAGLLEQSVTLEADDVPPVSGV